MMGQQNLNGKQRIISIDVRRDVTMLVKWFAVNKSRIRNEANGTCIFLYELL